MRQRWWAVALSGWLIAGPVAAQDAATAERLLNQILNQAGSFLPDAQVPVSRAALFRGELAGARAALEELASLGEVALGPLGRLARHPRAHARANAAYGLSLVGGPATVAPLQTLAADRNDGVRYQATLALGYTASAQGLVALNLLAGDDQGEIRNAAIQTGSVLREILAALQAPTETERAAGLVALAANDAACRQLVRLGETAVPALLQGLDSDDDGIVGGAAHALALIGDPRGLEPLWGHLIASLQSSKPQTKFAQALADYRHPQVWDYLKRLLENEQLDAAPVAQYYALRRLLGFQHPDRLALIHAFLGRLLTKAAHKEVIRGPETQVSPVATACEVLEKIGNNTSLALLDRVINEAPPADKSIVKPLAERAKAAIQRRGV